MKKIYPFILLIFISCSSNDSKKLSTWEGIDNNILRVAINEFNPDDEDRGSYRERVITAGKSRAALILVSHASLKIERSRVTPMSDELLNKVIAEIVENGFILSLDCSESGYCLSLIEYNITALNDVLKEINN